MNKRPPTLIHLKKQINELINTEGPDALCFYYVSCNSQFISDMTLHSWRIKENNFVTTDIYKSPRLRHTFARFIARLFRI